MEELLSSKFKTYGINLPLKVEKKWLLIGGGIGALSLLCLWRLRHAQQNMKKEEIVGRYIKKMENSLEKSTIAESRGKKETYENESKQHIKEFEYRFQKYIYGCKRSESDLAIFFMDLNKSTTKTKDFATRWYSIFQETMNQLLKLSERMCENKIGFRMMLDKMFESVFEQLLLHLKHAEQFSCDLLQILIGRSLLQQSPKGYSSVLEELFRLSHVTSLNTQEKLHTILQILMSKDEQFTQTVQINLANNIKYVSCIHEVRLMPSPLCRILSHHSISINTAEILIEEGLAQEMISHLCELCQRSPEEIIELDRVIENVYIIAMRLISEQETKEPLSNISLVDMLFKSLSLCETEETTTVTNTNVVVLVNWVTNNLPLIVARSKCSKYIQQVLLYLLSHNKLLSPHLVWEKYLNQVRWIHQVRKEDQLRGKQQLSIDLSITTLFMHLMMLKMHELPAQRILHNNFLTIPFQDEQERNFVVNSFSSLLSNQVFMKELFTSMLDKTVSQSNTLILALAEFKQIFFAPQAQFSILLGGCDILCESIVQRWDKDAEEYEDFKIYMSSDLAFLLQLLENDTCYLNMNVNWQSTLQNKQAKINFRLHSLMKVEKLIINYLQIYGTLEKESLREHLKTHIASSILESDNIFECALEEVGQLCSKTPMRSLNSSFQNNQNQFMPNPPITTSPRYELQEEFQDKYFHSLFNRDVPLLIKLLNKIQTSQIFQKNSKSSQHHDFHIESLLNDLDQPFLYLKQVRCCVLENIKLHSHFHKIFIQNETILLEKLRIVCRILNYIFDVIEEGIMDCRASKKLSKDSIKSLLVLYVFDPLLGERINYVSHLTDEEGAFLAFDFLPTLQNILFRREAIRDLIKDIFKGSKIADIIV